MCPVSDEVWETGGSAPEKGAPPPRGTGRPVKVTHACFGKRRTPGPHLQVVTEGRIPKMTAQKQLALRSQRLRTPGWFVPQDAGSRPLLQATPPPPPLPSPTMPWVPAAPPRGDGDGMWVFQTQMCTARH